MRVLSGSGGRVLGQQLANLIGCNVVKTQIAKFADGEARVEIEDDISKTESVFIVQSTNKDEYIIELLFIIDALKRLGVRNIYLSVPYFGYSRADRIVQSGSAIGAKVIANIIKKDIRALMVMDIHFAQFESFFDVPVYNLLADDLFKQHIQNYSLDKNAVVVAPDLGCVKKSRAFAAKLGLNVVIINKHRPSVGISEITDVVGDPSDKNCIILDDIVCGAGTLCGTANKLKKMGARSVVAFITHGVLSGNAQDKIANSDINELIITNSIEGKITCSKIKVVSAASVIAKKIKQIS